MRNTVKFTLLIVIYLAFSVNLWAISSANGFCETGNNQVQTGGQRSNTRVQQSFPACTINVFIAGTATLATIYSDVNFTPLTNPFTANMNGSWAFFAANGTYDINKSGGGIPSPVTVNNVTVFDPNTATGQVIDCAAPKYKGASIDATFNNCLTATSASGGVIDMRGFQGGPFQFAAPITLTRSNITVLWGPATYVCPSGATSSPCFNFWSGTMSVASNMSFIGVGRGATIFTYANGATCIGTPGITGNCNVFVLHNIFDLGNVDADANNLYFAHMTLDGNKANIGNPGGGGGSNDFGHNGFFSQGVTRVVIDDLEVKNWWYSGFDFGLYSSYMLWSNIYTSGNGQSQMPSIGYGGIQIQGSSTNDQIVNHYSTGDVLGAWINGNVTDTIYSGVIQNSLASGFVDTETSGNVGHGNIFTVSIQNCATFCAQVGGDNTVSNSQNGSIFNIAVTTTTVDDGIFFYGKGNTLNATVNSPWNACVRVGNSAQGNKINVTCINASQRVVGGSYAITFDSGATANNISYVVVDMNSPQRTVGSLSFNAGSQGNYAEGIEPITLSGPSPVDSGTNNQIIAHYSDGTTSLFGQGMRTNQTVTMNAVTGKPTLAVNGSANSYTQQIVASSTAGQSYGEIIQAGTNSSDNAFKVSNQANSTTYLNVRGDGQATITGTTTINGVTATGGNALIANGAANSFAIEAVGNSTAGQSFGQVTLAGTNSSDVAFRVSNQANTKQYFNIRGDGLILLNGGGQTFANTPACSGGGQITPITDSTTNVWGATITGGGGNYVLAFCDGTNWTVIGK